MTKVQIIVELTIDDSLEDINTILTEMDYNFSYKSNWSSVNNQELIINTEILQQIN